MIQFIHASIAQYLEQREEGFFMGFKPSLAKTCLRCLSKEDFLTRDNGNESCIKHWLSEQPFLAYSLTYWGFHARSAPVSEVLDGV